MNTKDSSCYGCKSRTVGCHINCESYNAFRKEKEKEYAKELPNNRDISKTRRNDRVYGVGSRIRREHNFGNQR